MKLKIRESRRRRRHYHHYYHRRHPHRRNRSYNIGINFFNNSIINDRVMRYVLVRLEVYLSALSWTVLIIVTINPNRAANMLGCASDVTYAGRWGGGGVIIKLHY